MMMKGDDAILCGLRSYAIALAHHHQIATFPGGSRLARKGSRGLGDGSGSKRRRKLETHL
jgi:type II secretory pathway pseudopilin PulG